MSQTDVHVSEGGVVPPPARATRWAWGICWLMFASTALNYMDRQTLAQVGDPIKAEFHLKDEDFGWVMAAFSLTYALLQVPAGYLVDRSNVHRTYSIAVAWWSMAGMFSIVSPSIGVLMAFRALLGVGESFNWPCALRVTATVLPPADRSLGNGIFNSGAAVGAVLAPLIVTPLAAHFGWRAPFVFVGSLGFVWIFFWHAMLRSEHRHLFAGRTVKPASVDEAHGTKAPGLSRRATIIFSAIAVASIMLAASARWYGRPLIWWGIVSLMVGPLIAARLLPKADLNGVDWAKSLGEIVRLRRFWVMVVVSISINVCWHFLVNWLPSYLQNDRKMAFLVGGMLAALPFLAADAGNLGGGALTRLLAGRGLSPVKARMTVMTVCTFIITSGAWVGVVRSNVIVMVLLALMAMATAAFMANYFAFTQEVDRRYTGLVVGILGGLGNLFAAGFLPVAGYIKDSTGGFAPVFVVVGLLPFVGMGALLIGWGKSAPEPNPV